MTHDNTIRSFRMEDIARTKSCARRKKYRFFRNISTTYLLIELSGSYASYILSSEDQTVILIPLPNEYHQIKGDKRRRPETGRRISDLTITDYGLIANHREQSKEKRRASLRPVVSRKKCSASLSLVKRTRNKLSPIVAVQ